MTAIKRRVVVVEDNPADAEILRLALGRVEYPLEIKVFSTGSDAIESLLTKGVEPCDLMLLDLNLPVTSGFEVLEQIRATPALRSLPVVVMSGSQNPQEIGRCYELGANSYIAKPRHLDQIFATAEGLVNYWFRCASLPSPQLSSIAVRA